MRFRPFWIYLFRLWKNPPTFIKIKCFLGFLKCTPSDGTRWGCILLSLCINGATSSQSNNSYLLIVGLQLYLYLVLYVRPFISAWLSSTSPRGFIIKDLIYWQELVNVYSVYSYRTKQHQGIIEPFYNRSGSVMIVLSLDIVDLWPATSRLWIEFLPEIFVLICHHQCSSLQMAQICKAGPCFRVLGP